MRRDLKLLRLRAVRQVHANAATRRLAAAALMVAGLRATGDRIDRLRDDLGLGATSVDGYAAKATAAAREQLDAATLRQRARIVAAEERRVTAAQTALADQAKADAVDRAIERNRVAAAMLPGTGDRR
jgi:hypothetical protein